jgi:putative DNA primase/helicase
VDQWVCWRWQRRQDKKTGQGKWTKVPVNPRTGANARPNQRATWGPFADALRRYQDQPARLAGVGFVFSPDDPYAGADFDDARDAATGDIDPWAAELLGELGGYAEVSPSGTGAKAVVKAVKPPGRCQGSYLGHKVEVYDRGRFFALTGHALPDCTAGVPERQQALEAVYRRLLAGGADKKARGPGGKAGANPPPNGQGKGAAFRGQARGGPSAVWSKPLDQLTDDDILQLAREARNGNHFRALWRGATSGHEGDDSRADAALCAILAYWCGKGTARIDRLFRRSGLMRPKWDEVHRADGATYGKMTVAFACAVCSAVYEGPQAEPEGATAGADPGTAGDRPAPSFPCSPGLDHYLIKDGRICRRRYDRQGACYLEPLCNFVARIASALRVDDGAEVAHFFTLQGQLAAGPPLPPVTVPAHEFVTMGWVLPAWGLHAVVSPGQGAAAQLRTAIQLLSSSAIEGTVYRHTGWRRLGERWGYLHAGGGITAAGLDASVTVDLDGRLGGYHLPAPPSGQDLQQAVRASRALIGSASERILAPLLGAVYRSVLGTVDFSRFLVGATGLGKSELSALAQQHFGRGLDRRGLAGELVQHGQRPRGPVLPRQGCAADRGRLQARRLPRRNRLPARQGRARAAGARQQRRPAALPPRRHGESRPAAAGPDPGQRRGRAPGRVLAGAAAARPGAPRGPAPAPADPLPATGRGRRPRGGAERLPPAAGRAV